MLLQDMALLQPTAKWKVGLFRDKKTRLLKWPSDKKYTVYLALQLLMAHYWLKHAKTGILVEYP